MKTIFIAHVIFIHRKIDHRFRFSEIFEKSMITNHYTSLLSNFNWLELET